MVIRKQVDPAARSASTHLYQSNAFRVLGLPVDASSRDVRRRAEELRLCLELDGSDQGRLEEIRSAATLLEDPVRRLTEELYWVHLSPNPIPPQFDPTDLTAIRGAIAAIEPLAQSGSDEALHDLAVLVHMAAIAEDGTGVRVWKEALSRWHQVWADDVFWLRMQMRAEAMADPRVTDETVGVLRADLPSRVLGPSVVLAGRLLDDSQGELAAGCLSLIQQSDFSPEAVAKACSDATSGIRTRLKAAIEELRAELAHQDEGDSSVLAPGFVPNLVWSMAQERVVPLVETLKGVYPEGTEVQVAADEAAELLTALSIRLHNEAEDSKTALDVAVVAEGIAASDSVRQRASQGVQILVYQVAFKQAMAHAEAKRWVEAAASARAAKEKTADPEERRQLELFITRCILQARASGQGTTRSMVTDSQPSERPKSPPPGTTTPISPPEVHLSSDGSTNPLVTGLKVIAAATIVWLFIAFAPSFSSTSGTRNSASPSTSNKSTSSAPTVFQERANEERFDWEADATGHPAASGSSSSSAENRVAAPSDIPDPVKRLLPAGSNLISAVTADFAGSGEASWAVLYTLPAGSFFKDAHLVLAVGDGENWRLAGKFAQPGAMGPTIELVSLSGRPSVVLQSFTGAHASQMMIVRWNGGEFQAVFGNSPGIGTRDLDGDGNVEVINEWSPYCKSYAASPLSISIYRWDGAGFVEDLTRYPDSVEKADARLYSALLDAESDRSWTESDRACLRDARKALADRSGRFTKVADLPSAGVDQLVVPAPLYPTDNRLFRLRDCAVQTSTTQGRTWERLSQLGYNQSCTSASMGRGLWLSPTFDRDQTMIYQPEGAGPASHSPQEVEGAISRDGGRSWEKLVVAAPRGYMFTYGGDFLFSPSYADDHRLWLASSSMLFGSSDGGKTWSQIALPNSLKDVKGFMPSGSSGGAPVLLLKVNDPSRDPFVRYYRSPDLGAHWVEITELFRNPTTLRLLDLTFLAGARSDRLYAKAGTQTLHSQDGGASWKAIEGSNTAMVAPDGSLVLIFSNGLVVFSDQSPKVSLMLPGSSQRLMSVQNVADHGTVLFQTSDGLWTYRFRP